MALNRVDPGIQYFPQFSGGNPIANAQIYIGVPDLDPSILANRYQAYVVQEDGTEVAIPQPINTGAGGVPTYNGSPVQIALAESEYSLKILNAAGAQIYYRENNTATAIVNVDQIAWQPPEPVFSIPSRTVRAGLESGVYNIKWDSRFRQDKTTDNTTYVAEAIANAYAENCALYIPSAPPGFYASIDGGILIQNLDTFTMFGDGTQSLWVNQSISGDHLITIDSSTHVRLRNMGLTGVTGAGSGLRFINGAHHFLCEGLWAGWIDGDAAYDIVEAISGRFIGCSVEENNGYDPAGLTDPVRGDTKRAWWVRSQAMGLNNDTNCVACKIDGAGSGSNYALQVGTPGGAQVESFYFQGLIQASERLVRFASARDSHIRDTHIEPPVGALGDYVVRFENSLNCSINGRNIQGDVLFDGSTNCGLSGLRTGGIVIEPDCSDIYVDDVIYGTINTGPAGGKLIDATFTSRIEATTNSSNSLYSIGDSMKMKPSKYFSNNMDKFVYIAGTLTAPCGFEKFGVYTPTLAANSITWSASQFRIDHTGDFTQGFRIRLAPIAQIRGRRILVDAIVLNQLVGGGAYIQLTTTGGASPGTNGQESFQLNIAERMQITFYIPADATSADLIFTGVTGARVNWAKIDIFAEGHTKITEEDSSTAALATPDISYNGASDRGGYQLETVVVGAGANITSFTNPHIGVPFTVRFTAGRTVVSSATLKLAGGVNFVATADDTLTLTYDYDNIFREVARSVNA